MKPNALTSETLASPLTSEEQAILDELRRLFDAGCEDVPDDLTARIRASICWCQDDPASMKRMLYFAEHDPFLKRESDRITREFACTEGDGLEGL